MVPSRCQGSVEAMLVLDNHVQIIAADTVDQRTFSDLATLLFLYTKKPLAGQRKYLEVVLKQMVMISYCKHSSRERVYKGLYV